MIRAAIVAVTVSVVLSSASVLHAATAVPHVVGPLPVTADSYPFGAADHTRVPERIGDVAYVEEEFLVSGTANVYDWPAPGPAVVRTANVPYTTRVLIRRPANRLGFSGTVLVEMLNPSNLFDLNLGWAISSKEIVRHGDVWVGITAKPVALATLKAFNPTRYATLSLANPVPVSDPRNCENVAADSARTTENGLIWDIYTQVGAWLKSGDPTNPLRYRGIAGPSDPPRHLYGWGYSQTGSYLYTYINAIHPLVVAAEGRPMFDAFLIAVSSGPSPINQCAPPLPQDDPRRVIRNAGVPVVRVMSGSDYLSGIAGRRDDSDVPADRYRNYEIAGSAHATPDELNFAAAPVDIGKGGREVPPMACNEGPRSRFPNGPAFNAILRNLDDWVRRGVAPPRIENIRVENGQPVLDEVGNHTGGIRSPLVDVPTSRWYGNSTGASFCRIAGHEEPLTAAALRARYGSADTYLNAVRQNISTLMKARMLLADDGELFMEDARQTAKRFQ